jgi:adenylate kinase
MKKTDPPFDDHMYYRFNDEMMVRMLKRRLQENDAVVYGFIVDGFPKNYAQAKELFEDNEKNIANPNSILLFDNIEDDFAINRIKTGEDFPKDPKDPKINIILERANRRLAKIKEEKTEENYKSLHDFFEEEENQKIFGEKLKKIDGKQTILDLIKDIQEFIKKNNDDTINQIDEGLDCTEYEYDYVKIEEDKNKPPEEPAPEEKEEEKKEEEKKEENNNPANNENNINKGEENKEKEKIKKSINDTTKREETLYEETKNSQDILNSKEGEDLNEIKEKEKKVEEVKKPKTQLEIEKENEFKLLEKKSEVLRRYLAENVLPLLSLGILHVANERPDDPVEALADYLLAKTFEKKKNDEGEGDAEALEENIKENNENDDKKDISLDLNIDHKDDIKLHFDANDDVNNNNKGKMPRSLSPIHKDNTNGGGNIEDDLNKAMIETDE